MIEDVRGWEGLEDLSKTIYAATYFLPNEDYEGWIHRVSHAYCSDYAHGERIKSYIRRYWMHTSTPPSTNAGTNRGLPISCYTKSVEDSKEGIFGSWMEGFWLGSYGGGIGTVWSDVRSVNEKVGQHGGKSSGVVPFLGVNDRATLAVSQGGLRRASEAIYLLVSHPEIEEFIDIRKPTGDQNRRTPNLHHGIVITDDFMRAVIYEKPWDLISPKDGSVVKTVDAKSLWFKIMDVRATMKGEPYLLFIDTVNKNSPLEYRAEGVVIKTSNLCTEITLRTDENFSGVCCLLSANLEYYDEWKDNEQFLIDAYDFLDNIMKDFVRRTEGLKGFEKARAAAIDEASLGFGVMGFHSLLQKRGIPWESAIAKGLNIEIFSRMKKVFDTHNASTDEICPMAKRVGSRKRNIHVTAIAPTMSISSLANVTSGGIEPWVTNAFTKKVNQGAFPVKNKYLDKLIREEAIGNDGFDEDWYNEQWASIKKHNGSVQHLEWMSEWDKAVFKTAFEIDQRWIIEFAGDRQPFIDQSQSVNLFIAGGSNVQYISDLHVLAWVKGLKSLYYLRSTAVNRASTAENERKVINVRSEESMEELLTDACIGCA